MSQYQTTEFEKWAQEYYSCSVRLIPDQAKEAWRAAARTSYEAAKKALDDTPDQDGCELAAIDNMLGALATLAGVQNV